MRSLLEPEKQILQALKARIEILPMIITLLLDKLGLNSKNSSKPSSGDVNWQKKEKKIVIVNCGGQLRREKFIMR